MARLKITRADGSVSQHEITPRIEYAFELLYKKGFHKAFREDEMNTHLYWVAWECIRSSGEVVPVFGAEFLETLKEVEVDLNPLG